ncbi:MAG: DUF3604 domain-containing protein [Gammaproteobacteria bacterium]|nr:DUF3604 domain-containing protein [Gammaproteobacteria bacterium]
MKARPAAAGAALLLAACADSKSGIADVAGGGEAVPGRCADFREGRKNAYFGDLHTHTSYSLDAYFFNAANDPRAAHRFAKGEVGGLPGLGSDDPYTQQREVRIGRPLDFNAVTDHAEFLGGFVNTCGRTPQTQQFCDERIGKGIRDDIVNIAAGNTSFQQQMIQALIGMSPTNVSAWAATRQINEEENEPCRYTTLHAYEFSSNELGQMFHRNVIFRGDSASVPAEVFGAARPDTAANPQNANDDWDLFDYLDLACKSRPGCDVLTIPHNGNLSDGRMWLPREPDSGVPLGRKLDSTDVILPMTAADAELRRSLDRAVEIAQHKGQSECAIGLAGGYLDGEESSCDFEIFKTVCRGQPDDPADCARFCKGDPLTDPNFCSHRSAGSNVVDTCANPGPDARSRPAHNPAATGTENCTHPLDYYRQAMAEGLAIKRTLGVNPYRANVVAASDTHNGISGNVAEKGFVGHGGVLDDEPREQFGFWACDGGDPADPANCTNRRFLDFARSLNPGGLAGVWAPENTRDGIWDALHRGESWGTSGPRIKLRSVGGWSLPETTCDRLAAGRNPVDTGETAGTLMGGELPLPAQGRPQVAVWAQQDPENYPLQRIDIVKGWVDAGGQPRVKVFEGVARTADRVERPSMDDCGVRVGSHPEQLCAIWTDPEFNPAQDTYYYARVLEVPSCRWSAWVCNVDKKVDCGKLDPANGMFPEASGLRGYEGCCAIDGQPGSFRGRNTFHVIEERAWTSPIWYEAPAP